jgi:tetratricopeptide (TPR) repeat protein
MSAIEPKTAAALDASPGASPSPQGAAPAVSRFLANSLDSALDLEVAGQPESAIRKLESLARSEPASADTLYHLGRMLRAAGRHEPAWASLSVAHTLRTEHPGTLRELAGLHLDVDNFEAAAPILEQLRQLRPSDLWTLRQTARVQAGRGAHVEAIGTLDAYLFERFDDRSAHLELCRECLAAGRPDRARAELEILARRGPLEPAGLSLLGLLELAQGSRDRGISLLREALAGGGADRTARVVLARALLALKDTAGVLAALDGVEPPEFLLEGRARLAQGDSAGALACADRALAGDRDDREAVNLKADALEARGEFHGALGACLRARDLGEPEPGLPMRIARLQVATGQVEQASATLAARLRQSPDDREALGLAAALEARAGRDKAALKLLERLTALEPGLGSAHLSMAQLWLRHDCPRRALAAATAAAKLLPRESEAMLALAQCEEAGGDTGPAELHYQEALRLGASGALPHRRLAAIYSARGACERALEHGQEAARAGALDAQLCLELAWATLHLGNRTESLKWVQQGLALEPAEAGRGPARAGLLEVLAVLELSEGRLDAAADAAGSALAGNAGLRFARRVLGLSLARAGRRDAALTHLTRALSDHPEDDAVRLELARAHFEAGSHGEVVALYPEAAGLQASQETLGLMVGRSALLGGDAPRARQILQNLADSGCDSLELLETLAEACEAGGDRATAEAVLTGACRKHPRAVAPHRRLARLRAATGRIFEARQELATARQLEPGEPELYLESALLELEDRRVADATPHAEAYLRLAPRDPRGHLARGRIYLLNSQPQQAEQCFRKALGLEPEHLDTCLALGRLLLRQGRNAEAKRVFEGFASRSSRRESVLADLASVYVAEDKPREAEAYLRELIACGPEGRPGIQPLVELLLAQKRDREALTVVEGAGNEAAAILTAQAETLRRQGERRRARLLLERALTLGAEPEVALLGIAGCHLESGEHAQARQRLEELLAARPGSRAAALELARVLNAESLVAGPTAPATAAMLDRGLELLGGLREELQNSTDGLNLLASMAVRRDRHAEAAAAIARSLELDGKQASVHALNGDVCLAGGDRAGALEAYLKALALDAGLEDAACRAIAFLEASGHLVQAREIMERVVEKRPLSRRARLALARLCYRLGDHRAAALHWEGAAREAVLGPDDAAGLAAAYLAQRRFGDAERVNAAWLGRDPRALEPLLLAGDIARAAGRIAEARVRYEQAARLHPNAARCPAKLAELYHADGRQQDALFQIRRALELEPASAGYMLKHGQLLFELDRAESAREVLEKLAKRPDAYQAQARLLLGRVYRRLEDRRQAVQTLQDLLESGQAGEEALRELAELHFERGDWNRAGDVYERLNAKRGGLDSISKERLALCYARMGMTAKGTTLLRELGAKAAVGVELVLETARAYARQGALREALTLLVEQAASVAAGPARARLHLEMASLHHRAGDRKASERELMSALKLQPEDEAAQSQVAAFLEETGQFQAMRTVFAGIVQRYPANARGHCHLGDACLRLGLDREAKQAFSKAVRLDYNFFGAHAGLARACRNAGETTGALEEYRKALFLNPKNARLTFEMATALAEEGQPGAVAAFEKVLELETPSSALATAAREHLRKLKR